MVNEDKIWHPFTYDQFHVRCAVVHLIPNIFESVVVSHRKVFCDGKLWYRWDEKHKISFDMTCDECNKSFHPDQMELF